VKPLNLDGTDPFDSPAGVRLDEFCAAPPAQLQVQQHDGRIHSLLSTPGLGARAEVDFVIAELNAEEFPLSTEPLSGGPFLTNLIQSPTRLGVNDVIVHPSLGPLQRPEIHLYRNIGETQARHGDPAREVDRIESTEPLQQTSVEVASMRLPGLPGLPRYGELLAAVFARLGWHFDTIPLFRAELAYPVPGTQITLLFRDTRF